MKEYYIYMHRCKLNGKVYIGQTCQNPENRWRHGEGYKECTYFYNAILKYGWDNFEHLILEEGLTATQADEKEKYWIKKFNSTDSSKGYNLKSGGKCNSSYNIKSKNKMSNSAKQRFKDEDERKQQSERIKELYQKNPEIWNNVKKPIQCVETGEIFDSISDAAKWCGINSLSSFGNFFAGRSKSCGRHPITKEKLHWKKL